MSTPTKLNVNWSGVSFASTAITKVTNGSFGMGGTLLKFKGDTNVYSTVICSTDIEPHCSFTTGDIATMTGFVPGTAGSLAATLNDALGVSAGNIAFTTSNAVFENADASAAHAQYGTVTGTWQLYSSDGVTNPLSISG
jgi:hypothetical protein